MDASDLLAAIGPAGSDPWRQRAACRGMTTEIFFRHSKRLALQVCDECEVQQDCFDYNREFEQRIDWSVGVYGGTTPAERRVLYKETPWSSGGNPTFSTNPEETQQRDGVGSSEV